MKTIDRRFGAAIAFAFAAQFAYAQADQAANAQKQRSTESKGEPAKEKSGADALAALLGPRIDQPAAERGRKIFIPNCGFCHGNDAHGKSGPDLVRSSAVLHDSKGETIGPILRNGRPDRGMPAFASFSNEQIADISTFLHARAASVANRFAYKIGDLITGDAHKGEAFFNGSGQCNTCHSPTGNLAHIANKYEPVELQRRMLYPAPNLLDIFMGKKVTPTAPTKVSVQLASGERVSGTLDHLDEFTVTMHDENGWERSFTRDRNATVNVEDPRAAHNALLPKYTDDDMHNVLAYLETLR